MGKKHIKYITGIVLILASYTYIIYKITHFNELKALPGLFSNYTLKQFYFLFFVFSLMPVNWAIETLKWRILINKIQPVRFGFAFKAVLAGISIGIFTPNRIGEIGGRVLFLGKKNRTSAILATGIGSFAQFISTLVIGIMGFILFLKLFREKTYINNSVFNDISAIILFIFLLFSIWCFFNIKRTIPVLLKLPFLKNRKKQFEYLSKTKSKTFILVLIMSILRYTVFAFQYYLLLIFFNIHITALQAVISISLVYLFATLIPSTILAEIGIRGSLSIFFVGLFSTNILGIILATTILWFINIVMPSVIGSLFFIKNKLRLNN